MDFLPVAEGPIIFIGTPIDDAWRTWSSPSSCSSRWRMPRKTFQLYINSPGGVVTADGDLRPMNFPAW